MPGPAEDAPEGPHGREPVRLFALQEEILQEELPPDTPVENAQGPCIECSDM